jgi:RNA polymerase sigma factor (sigma-70 family)
MRSETLGSVVRRLRVAAAPHPAAPHPDGPDADLVRAFAAGRDPAAFAAIVRRHGPMVLGVCRRVLRDPADADDAFQATFLVLVRRARSLRQPDRLAGWLHQVAQRTARKLRATRLARARREGELFDVPAGEPVADFVWRELRPVFDHELGRLPDKLRLPAVLCFLEGQSKGEAARTLGWPEGTLAGRLQQAREKLRVRFAARGLTLSAGALAVALFEGAGSAAVSDRLIASTLQAAAAGPAGATGAGVWALADGVTQAMFHTKAKAVAACLLAAGLLGTGTGVVLVPGTGPGKGVAGQASKDPPKKPAPEGKGGETYDFVEGRKEIDRAVEAAVIADLQRRNIAQRAKAHQEQIRAVLTQHIQSLRSEAERVRPLVDEGALPVSAWDRLQRELRESEDQLKKLPVEPAKDPERAVLQAELEQLKERAAWEERMVKKGFMAEAQVKKTRAEVARAETALAQLDAPKAPDPRRAALEEIIRKAEEIVARTEEGVKKGIVPQQELFSAQMKVLEYKLRLAELEPRPAAEPRAERPAGDRGRAAGEARQAIIAQKETELRRAQALLRENAVSQEVVRHLKIGLCRLKGESAEAAGDHAAAVKFREEVVAEWEGIAAAMRRLADDRAVSQGAVRAVEAAVAEAKVDALKAAARQQLAEIVRIRERDLAEANKLFEARTVSAEVVRKAEQALHQARLRLAEER